MIRIIKLVSSIHGNHKFSSSYLELGEQDKGNSFFNRSYAPYVREPFKIWTEVQSGVGAVNFITGAGGFLQALISGYAGIRIHPDSLEIKQDFGTREDAQ